MMQDNGKEINEIYQQERDKLPAEVSKKVEALDRFGEQIAQLKEQIAKLLQSEDKERLESFLEKAKEDVKKILNDDPSIQQKIIELNRQVQEIFITRHKTEIDTEMNRIKKQIEEWEAQLSAPPKVPETQRIEDAKKEIFERAGKRTKEEMIELIGDVYKVHYSMLEQGVGKLPTTINEAEKLGFKEIVCEGLVTFIPKGAGELVIIGDLHGDFVTLRQIIDKKQFIENMESDNPSIVLVFEGDYLDRGKKDVEVMEALLELKRRYPKNVVLMKADHEVKRGKVSHHDYPDRAESHYGDDKVFDQLHDQILDILPRAVFCGNGVVMVHGGPLYYDLDLKKLARLHGDSSNARTAFDEVMTWADPQVMSDSDITQNQTDAAKLIEQIDKVIPLATLSSDKLAEFHGEKWSLDNLERLKKRIDFAAKNGFWFNPSRVGVKGRSADVIDAAWNNIVVYSEKGLEYFLNNVGGKVLIRGHQVTEKVNGGNPFSKNIFWTIHSTGEGSPDSAYTSQDMSEELDPKYAVFDRNQDITEIDPTKNIIEVWK